MSYLNYMSNFMNYIKSNYLLYKNFCTMIYILFIIYYFFFLIYNDDHLRNQTYKNKRLEKRF